MNIFFFEAAKTNTTKLNIFSVSFKQNKKRLLLPVPEKQVIERSMCVKLKYQLLKEKRYTVFHELKAAV